jgi:hypothetical protein
MPTESTTAAINENLRRLLRDRYKTEHYAFIEEARNATGFSATRSADALALSLYQSRGQLLTGFEIKVSRGDFLRELKEEKKAEEIAQYCDLWYLVVPDRDIVRDDLPHTWGLMVPNSTNNKLRIVVKPTQFKPRALDRHFFCAFVQQAVNEKARELTGKYGADALEHSIMDRIRHARDEEAKSKDLWFKHERDVHQTLLKKVSEFEAASGISLNHYWPYGNVGAALKKVLDGDNAIRHDVEMMLASLERQAASLQSSQEMARASAALNLRTLLATVRKSRQRGGQLREHTSQASQHLSGRGAHSSSLGHPGRRGDLRLPLPCGHGISRAQRRKQMPHCPGNGRASQHTLALAQ